MTDRDGTENDATDLQVPAGDEIARLIRAAGPRPGVPAERAERIRNVVHAEWRRTVRGRRVARSLAWGALPLAAAAAWALFFAPDWSRLRPVGPSLLARAATLERSEGSVIWADREQPPIGADLPAGTSLETGMDGRAAVRLETGVSVRVDAGTRLRLASTEEVFLDRGAVYLDTGNPPRPGAAVTVRTALGIVRDVGTQFQVRVREGAVQVNVREGAARLERQGTSHEAPSGVELTLRSDGEVTTRNVSPSGPEWDWVLNVAPPFLLEGRRLGEYLDWVERETGLRIEFADPRIAPDASAIVLHGSIEGLRPDETLAAVLPTCGLTHSVQGGAITLYRAPPGSGP